MNKLRLAVCAAVLVLCGCGKAKGPARVIELLDPKSGATTGGDDAIKQMDAFLKDDPGAVLHLIPVMKHKDGPIRRDAVAAVPETTVNAAVTKALIEATMDSDSFTRRTAAGKLSSMSPEVQAEASAACIARLSSAVEDERASAAAALRPIKAKDLVAKALPALNKALSDASPGVRYEAAHTLAKLDPENAAPAVPALIETLGPPGVQDSDTRDKAARDLHTLAKHCAGHVPALARGLGDSSAMVRIELLGALAALGPAAKDARAAIETCTTDASEDVQREANKALAALGN